MINDLLTSSVIPGSGIEHHEHRKLLTVLVVVAVMAVIAGLFFWWSSFGELTSESNAPTSEQAIVGAEIDRALRKAATVPITEKVKTDVNAELSKAAKIPITQSQKDAVEQALLKLK